MRKRLEDERRGNESLSLLVPGTELIDEKETQQQSITTERD